MTLYADDPDVHVDFEITDASGGLNEWTPVTVELHDGTEKVSTWQGDPGATRTLRVPLTGLAAGQYRLRLVVPGGNDLDLGRVYLQ